MFSPVHDKEDGGKTVIKMSLDNEIGKMGGSGVKNERATTSDYSAYLGPKLWDRPLSLEKFNEDDFFVMNISEFLAENNFQETGKETEQDDIVMNDTSESEPYSPAASPRDIFGSGTPASPMGNTDSGASVSSPQPSRPSIIVSNKAEQKKPSTVLPRVENSFLYTESKRARLEREKEERKRRLEEEIEFAPEDLALATLPGADFDPRERAFDMEELRPQPIIRKRPKVFVSANCKDDKYWENRTKNNVAARRSREARRLKENQIALRAAFLEKENNVLKKQVEEAKFTNVKQSMEIDILKQKLAKYESFGAL